MPSPQVPIPASLRRERAVSAVQAAVADLADLGVVAIVTGSLARGAFRSGSDVDLIVTVCPRPLKYAIEGVVEERLGDIPFDVIYLDEIPTSRIQHFIENAVDARDLR